jgi:hypothetical protein
VGSRYVGAMNSQAWAERGAARSQICRIVQLLVILLAPMAFAERLEINPDTKLSLDFKVPGATPCILVPEKARDPEACAGVPQEKAVPPTSGGGSIRALVFLRQPGHVFILTVASVQRSGIGQLYDQHLRGFIQGTLKNLSQEFGGSTHVVETAGKTYTIQKENGVPVARWEYATELPDSDPRSNTANAVVYVIPSRDTLDILSVTTRQEDLAAARSVGDQVLSTLQVPLTIDAEKFGGDMTYAVGWAVARVLVPLVLVLAAVGWGVWRYLKARKR